MYSYDVWAPWKVPENKMCKTNKQIKNACINTNTQKRIHKYTIDTCSGNDRSSVTRSIFSFRCMTATRRPTNSWDAFVDDKLCRREMNDEVLRRKRRMGGCINVSAASWSVVLMKSHSFLSFSPLDCFLSRVSKQTQPRVHGESDHVNGNWNLVRNRFFSKMNLVSQVWGMELQDRVTRQCVPRAIVYFRSNKKGNQ